MDPLSALSVGAAAVQFADFAARLVTLSSEIYTSTSGDLLEIKERRSITENLQSLTARVKTSATRNLAQHLDAKSENEIKTLCEECDEIAQELLACLDKLRRTEGKTTRWRSFRQALSTIWSHEDIERLERRLGNYKQQIAMHILFSLRYVPKKRKA